MLSFSGASDTAESLPRPCCRYHSSQRKPDLAGSQEFYRDQQGNPGMRIIWVWVAQAPRSQTPFSIKSLAPASYQVNPNPPRLPHPLQSHSAWCLFSKSQLGAGERLVQKLCGGGTSGGQTRAVNCACAERKPVAFQEATGPGAETPAPGLEP